MKHENKFSRRAMLGSAASLALSAPFAAVAQTPGKESTEKSKPSGSGPLPTRKLGRNGPEVSMLALGGQAEALSPDYYNKAYDMGIRYFDLAESYRAGESETALAGWAKQNPERRKDVFITTKDKPKKLSDIPGMIEKRLKNLGLDYLDWFLIHGIGAGDYGEESYEWPKSPEYKKICEEMKASGKVRMMGFSCHDMQSSRYLHAAAEGGFVDAILLHSSPFHIDGDVKDQAYEACHKAGIGLVGMKVMRNASKVPKRIPEFDKLGLTTHQAALHALWSDERFSAGVIWMANEEQMKENTDAARMYKKPLLSEHRKLLHDTMLAHGPSICPGCPSCMAAVEEHGIDLNTISRYVAYYEQDGTTETKAAYQAMAPAARDLSSLDLETLHKNCNFHVNYPEIAKRANYYFA